MTEQELRFVLTAQDEGLRKGIEAAEKAVLGLDNAVLDLAKAQLSYNTAAKRFVDESGKFVGSHQALNRLGLTTTQQLQQQVRAYDELIVRYKSDVVLTRQLVQQKEALLRQFGAVGKGLRSNTQLYFQAGQAISDFAVAGIRGAANNIEFLAASLGASAPLLIGISVAAAAFFTFGDDITKALTPIREQAKATASSLKEMLKVIENERPDLTILEDQIPAALEESKKKLEELEKQVRGSFFNSPFTGGRTGIFDALLGTDEEIRRLGVLRGQTETFQKLQDDLNDKAQAAADGQENSILRNNALRAETIRLDLELAGLAKESKDLTNTQILELYDKVGLVGIIKELTKDQVTEEEKITEKLKEARREIELIYGARRTNLEVLKEELSAEQERLKRLTKIKAATDQIAKANSTLAGATGFQGGAGGAAPIRFGGGTLSAQEVIDQQKKRSGSNVLRGEFLNEQLLKDYEDEQEAILKAQQAVIAGTDRTAEAFRKAGYDAATFYTTTRQGQVALQETIAKSVGSISGSFADLFQSMATSSKNGAQGLFVAYKAFATAQAIINTYQAASKALAEGGPILGPILAAAAIVQGGVLVGKIAATKPGDSSVSGGVGSSRTPSVTALGFGDRGPASSRAVLSRPTGSVGAGRGRSDVNLTVTSVDSYTPAGDRIRSIRAALNTDAKQGGSGKL